MSDIANMTASVETTLRDIAKQSYALGVGLQNAAPGEKLGGSNKSVDYLLAIADVLNQYADQCKKNNNNNDNT